MSDEAIPEDAKTNYAKSPAAIRAVAENIAENYAFDPNVLAGAICSALVMERERCAKIADEGVFDEHALAQATQHGIGYHTAAILIASYIRSSHE